ncbi:MAG: hypothetical protein SFU99_05195 [Saprospiraceae bacterium]|nr:hypothetical protein [Saprospiraceae bacterium]
MKIRTIFIIISGFCAQHLIAQIEFTDNFRHLVENAGIDFYEPTEGSYKEVKLQKHSFQPCDFGIRSRREKLEIRYLIAPYSEYNIAFKAPHVECFRMVSNLATNEEDAAITSLSISEDELKENFNADWGKIYFFQPKDSFSERAHCKMLALYSEGKGMALVFFLFDEPSRDLDNRYLALRFKDEANN